MERVDPKQKYLAIIIALFSLILQLFYPAPEFAFFIPARRLVADDRRDGFHPAVGGFQQPHGKCYREWSAASMQCRDAQKLGSVAGLAGFHDGPKTAPVPFPV